MTLEEKKSLYESIMIDVAKIVKRNIEEYSKNNDIEVIEEGWKENRRNRRSDTNKSALNLAHCLNRSVFR